MNLGKDAIQEEDVSEDPEKNKGEEAGPEQQSFPVQQEYIDPREEMMESIIAKREEELRQEIGEAVSAEEAVSDDEEGKQAPSNIESPAQTEEMITITVDGKEQQMPLSKIKEFGIRAAQKIETGDRRLEEASLRAKEIERRERELLRKEQELSSLKPKEDAGDKSKEIDVSAETVNKAWAQVQEAIDYGSKEEQEQARKNYEDLLIKAKATPHQSQHPATQQQSPMGYSENDIEMIYRKIRIRDSIESPPDKGGFGDMLFDPFFGDRYRVVVAERVDSALGAGDPNILETYQKACSDVKKEFLDRFSKFVGVDASGKSETPQKTSPGVTVNQNDLEKRRISKKRIDYLPTAGSKQTSQKTEEREQTAQEIIAEEAEFRRTGVVKSRSS